MAAFNAGSRGRVDVPGRASRVALVSSLLAALLGLTVIGCSESDTADSAGDASTSDLQAPTNDGTATGDVDTDTRGVPKPPPGPTDAVYDPTRVIEVAIEMAPGDWEALRHEVHSVDELFEPTCKSATKPEVFKYYPAKVTVDGHTLEQVGVRKKGFLGSASASKPSLKIDFGELVADQELLGLEKLTLNNALQDTSLVKQCLALSVFRSAGVPASRCNFAHVTVNGQALGVYVNIEGVTKRMLARWFEDTSGNLYEAQLSDFREGWTQTYEKKTNPESADRSDLDAVVAALTKGDADLESALAELVDLDAFLRFWAAETLVAHWDGYANNLNNHFAYHDPKSGTFHFLPWSPDMSLTNDDPFMPDSRPALVSANGVLAKRLYDLPATRARYVAQMKLLLERHWDEGALLAEIDRLAALVKPLLREDQVPHVEESLGLVREFVSGRREAIEKELPEPPEWDYPPKATVCYQTLGTVSGSFDTTWGTAALENPFQTGKGTFDLELPMGSKETAIVTGSAAGMIAQGKLGISPHMQLLGLFEGNRMRVVVLFVEPERFAPGVELPFDWQTAFGYVLELENLTNPVPIGALVNGTLRLDSVSQADGEPIKGTFEAEIAN